MFDPKLLNVGSGMDEYEDIYGEASGGYNLHVESEGPTAYPLGGGYYLEPNGEFRFEG